MDSEDQMAVNLIDNDLPEGWALPRISDLIELNYGKGLKEADRKLGPVSVYGSNGIVGSHNTALTKVPSIIIGRKGSVGAVHYSPTACWPIDTTYYVDKFNGLNPMFLMYALRLLNLADLDTSTAIPGLNRNDVYSEEIPLPPINEQKRIVAKVEELLTRVNATKERLAKVSVILKRFRQAVLAAACSGRLTADWRENQNVLKEIGNIQDELSNMLPESWTRAKLSQVTKINMGQSPPGSSYNERGDGLPFFQGKADFGDRYPTVRVWCNEPKKIAQSGDVLITIRAPVGPTNVANKICAIGRGLAAISPKEGMTSEFILFALRLKEPELALSGTGSTFTAIKRKDLEQIDINVPPITEQHEIVRRVESMFKLADAVKKRVAAAKVRSDKLTQAILAKAFRGELVPTEAELASREARSYEPASELLARIKSERDSNGALQKAPQVRGHKKRSK
jgi:type I restriction enzyme S subunit